jgi:hypothetical protein
MRRQIFRQIKQKAEGILGVFPSIFVKYGGKSASRRALEARAENCAALPLLFPPYTRIMPAKQKTKAVSSAFVLV